MGCHVCGQEAVDRCYTCGRLFCARHGTKNCDVCENSIVEGDPSPERITAGGPKGSTGPAWWRPQPADDYKPPGCHICGGLTRARCVNCGEYYCAEHAGRRFRCGQCGTSADISMAIAAFVLVMFTIIGFMVWWQSS